MRFESAPLDGGIPWHAQEEDHLERAREIERAAYLCLLHDRILARVDLTHWALFEAGLDPKVVLRDLIWWAIRQGVHEAEDGSQAEWIVEGEHR